MAGEPGRAVRNDQAPVLVRYRPLLLMRMPPVYHQRRAIKLFPEEVRIGFVHVTALVRGHAIGRYNGAFNNCASHACSLTLPCRRRKEVGCEG